MRTQPLVIDAMAPRSLDSAVIRSDARGTIVLVSMLAFLAAGTATIPLVRFEWVLFGVCAAMELGLLVIMTRVVLSWYRVRRTWQHGQLVDATVRRSTIAWEDFNGRAYTLELALANGLMLTFDYAQGQIEGATFPALVHDGWILVIFDVDSTALKRLTRAPASNTRQTIRRSSRTV